MYHDLWEACYDHTDAGRAEAILAAAHRLLAREGGEPAVVLAAAMLATVPVAQRDTLLERYVARDLRPEVEGILERDPGNRNTAVVHDAIILSEFHKDRWRDHAETPAAALAYLESLLPRLRTPSGRADAHDLLGQRRHDAYGTLPPGAQRIDAHGDDDSATPGRRAHHAQHTHEPHWLERRADAIAERVPREHGIAITVPPERDALRTLRALVTAAGLALALRERERDAWIAPDPADAVGRRIADALVLHDALLRSTSGRTHATHTITCDGLVGDTDSATVLAPLVPRADDRLVRTDDELDDVLAFYAPGVLAASVLEALPGEVVELSIGTCVPDAYGSYVEHERAAYEEHDERGVHARELLTLAHVAARPDHGLPLQPDFRRLARVAQLAPDLAAAERVFAHECRDERDRARVRTWLAAALAWARRAAPPNARITVLETPHASALTADERAALRAFGATLAAQSEEELDEAARAVAERHGLPHETFYRAAYRALLGTDHGPRLGELVTIAGHARIAHLLDAIPSSSIPSTTPSRGGGS